MATHRWKRYPAGVCCSILLRTFYPIFAITSFFRVEQVGDQKVLYLNTEHRFYLDVYTGPESTPRLRACLEIVLFVIGECEIDAEPGSSRQLFYKVERGEWSKGLDIALDRLEQIDSVDEDLTDYGEETAAQPLH